MLAAVKPDAAGRVAGPTFPSNRIDPPARPLGLSRWWSAPRATLAGLLAGAAVTVLRPQPGDVLVVRTPEPLAGILHPDWPTYRRLRRAWSKAGGGPVLLLPWRCAVHAEAPAAEREDFGYAPKRPA